MTATHDDPDAARVETRQIPIFARDARTVCLEIGLTVDDARRLHRDDLLSFDPEAAGSLDDAREAELVFLGSLVHAGCTRPILRGLLRGLHKPYCYDLRRLFYDWCGERWRLHPGEDDPVGAFFGLLGRLQDREERQTLLDIRDWLDEALDLEHDRKMLFAHESGTAPMNDPDPRRGDGSSSAR